MSSASNVASLRQKLRRMRVQFGHDSRAVVGREVVRHVIGKLRTPTHVTRYDLECAQEKLSPR